MRPRKKAFSAALVAAAGVIGGSLVATPAYASQADCANYDNTICLVENGDWTGRVWRQYPTQIIGCRRLSADNFDNKATILWNHTTEEVGLYVYDNANCTGTYKYFGSNSGGDYQGDPFDNKASSVRIVWF